MNWRDPSYPDSIRARAVAMKAAGERHKTILGMIRAECERAPAEGNLSNLLKRWAVRYPSEGHQGQGQMSG